MRTRLDFLFWVLVGGCILACTWVSMPGASLAPPPTSSPRPAFPVQMPAAELSVLAATVDGAGQLWVVGQAGDEAPALWMLEPGDK